MSVWKFHPDRPATLTPEYLRAGFERILATVPAAEAAPDATPWLRAIADWNDLRGYFEGERARVFFALAGNLLDPEIEARERHFRVELQPVQDEAESRFLKALVDSRHRAAIAERHGRYFLDRVAMNLPGVAEVNSALRVQVGELATQYDKAVAEGEVCVGGETMTLTRAVALAQGSPDESERREAYLAHRQWFVAHRDALAGLFEQMVALRDAMGRHLGHANFVPLGYAGMSRTDYGPAQAAQFRQGVREHFVPLYRRLMDAQAQSLGQARLKPWNAGYYPALAIPLGAVPVEGQLAAAQAVFSSLSPVLGAHFRTMTERGLIDLENRKGKRSGAFCTSFPDQGQVAIFCNATGQATDVRTLMHEMGHAFQAWESQAIELVELQWPTADAAEVHSMGMEYLSLRYIDRFFADPEHARRFRRKRWLGALEMLCYMVVVDEFQHWVYENPAASWAERDQAWDRIWEVYIPGLDFEGIEACRTARWYAQMHIFRIPFYYIDYAIAETGAMQLAALDAQDPARAMDTYLALCRLGGTRGVLDIFASAGLRSPFDAGVMADLAALLARECALD